MFKVGQEAWKIIQNKKPDFFIIASGQQNSVKDFVNLCFKKLGLKYSKHVRIDKKLLRPSKTSSLLGDITKARKTFKFNPSIIGFFSNSRVNKDCRYLFFIQVY